MIFELVLSDKEKEKKLYEECIKARNKIEKWHEPVSYSWVTNKLERKYRTYVHKSNTIFIRCKKGHKYRVFRTAKNVTPCYKCLRDNDA